MIQGGSSKPKGHVDFKSAFYFQTPIWIADAPMFLKNTINEQKVNCCLLLYCTMSQRTTKEKK